MIEPDWTTAPAWAQWFTVDDDGTGWWWKTKPKLSKMIGSWAMDESLWWEIQPAGVYLDSADDWEHSLRQRPSIAEEQAKNMIEPDWTQAPAWAQWFAVDDDGEAWWYETKPLARLIRGVWRQEFPGNIYRRSEHAGVYPKAADDWKHSLRQRP